MKYLITNVRCIGNGVRPYQFPVHEVTDDIEKARKELTPPKGRVLLTYEEVE